MKLIPIVVLVLAVMIGGCSRKPAVKVTPTTDILKAAIVDFAGHIPNQGDTLYIAIGNQDPPAALLEQVKQAHVVILPASQKADSSGRTTFTLYPDSATVGDSVSLKIKWNVGNRGANGVAVVVRRADKWTVNWDWRAGFGS